jgi:hypothetical protein
MVRTPTKGRRATPRRAPRAVRAATPPIVHPMTLTKAKARLEVVERRLLRAKRTMTRFARNSSREVVSAAQALRQPMQSMARTLRLAGRNIARDARAAWLDMLPVFAVKMPKA